MEIFLYLGIFGLVVFVIGTIIWLIARRFPYDPYEGMSDEQVTAIKRQGDAAGVAEKAVHPLPDQTFQQHLGAAHQS